MLRVVRRQHNQMYINQNLAKGVALRNSGVPFYYCYYFPCQKIRRGAYIHEFGKLLPQQPTGRVREMRKTNNHVRI